MKYIYEKLYNYINFYVGSKSVVELNTYGTSIAKSFVNGTSLKAKKTADYKKLKKADVVLLNSTLHHTPDILELFENINKNVSADSRIIGTYYNNLWNPLIRLATKLKIRASQKGISNWITHSNLKNVLFLTGFELVVKEQRILIPVNLGFFSNFANKYLATLPLIKHLCLVNIFVARPVGKNCFRGDPSVSVIIPARNEEKNLEKLLRAIPKMGPADEYIFIEGGSKDNTWEEILRLKKKYAKKNIVALKQPGKGKNDAVIHGFDKATKQIFLILDSDYSVPPESLTKFYEAIAENRGELIIGNRLMYPLEEGAMQMLNMFFNKFFGVLFSYTLGQEINDTLCGTKVISKKNYKLLKANKAYFGDFDPFGDFDLIYGSVKLGLKIVNVPVHYKARTYGSTNINRWAHGFLLIKMIFYSFSKIKFL